MTASEPHPSSRPAGASGTAAADELAHFAAMAESWWDPHGKFRPLHRLNPTRLGFIRERVIAHFGLDPEAARPFTGLTVLDIGCGGGLIAEPLSRLGARVTGIDADEKTIEVAKLHAREGGLDIDYRCTVPEALAADASRKGIAFDIVLNLEVIEHVADIDLFADACARLVKPEGAMALSTINRTLKSLAFAKIGAEYVLRWLPAGTHDWRKFVKPSELARALRTAGMEVTDLKGMTYNPLTDAWSLSRDLDVNYLAFAVRR